jgi:hypothetical protein
MMIELQQYNHKIHVFFIQPPCSKEQNCLLDTGLDISGVLFCFSGTRNVIKAETW